MSPALVHFGASHGDHVRRSARSKCEAPQAVPDSGGVPFEWDVNRATTRANLKIHDNDDDDDDDDSLNQLIPLNCLWKTWTRRKTI